ncbi:hypothetical protein P170DRAFT_431673 [Aspergillus steynii IBT 23096]|uniref:Actin-like ATPase domain-containing protein n=1 Tax=Aspergillus steynii IBT 23096 TaxID=1392250 RepID=A0A2I2GM23_9EURO|nr:uncharacterized protein P170DRAFT_431673 [Aspergillus steynii IBT 23096]PLB53909.1 hypothetical protein P170DRAFT_431673 [Aspergillus steynii IBT 23096]
MFSARRWQIIWLVSSLIWALQVHGRRPVQSIGIDIGPGIVTAVYAYDTDNVTTIATVVADAEGGYRDTMMRLWLLHLQEHPSPFTKNSKGSSTNILTPIWKATEPAASFIEPYLLYLGDVGLPPWIGSAVSIGLRAFKVAAGGLDADSLSPIPAEDITNEFVTVLRQIKEKALEHHNIQIRHAVFSAPSFFNSTLTDLIVEAARAVRIQTSPLVIPRTIAPVYAQNDDLKDNKTIQYLIIDQGEFHCDLRTTLFGDGTANKGVMMPMEPFASASINRQLATKLISESKDMQRQIEWGANSGDLWQLIRKARFLIRDDIDSELMGEEKTEDHHLDEYPLDLQGWGDGSVQAVLKWEDVQKEEQVYMESLGRNILQIMIAVRGLCFPMRVFSEKVYG